MKGTEAKEGLFTERIERRIKHTDKEGFYGTPFRFWINQNLKHWLSKYCPLDNAEILEVGCGEGLIADVIKGAGIKGHYSGVDIKESQNWANSNEGNQLKINFISQDAHTLSSIKKNFNFCISITAFEHFFDDARVLEEIKKVLLPDAVFLLVVPSKYSYCLYGKHGYRRYSKKSIIELAERYRFQVIEMEKLVGVFGFLTHFLWSFISRILRITGKFIYYKRILTTPRFYYKVDNIMHLHLNHSYGKRIHKRLQKLNFNLDQKFIFLESGYFVALRNK